MNVAFQESCNSRGIASHNTRRYLPRPPRSCPASLASQKPFYVLGSSCLSQNRRRCAHRQRLLTSKAMWKLGWFLRDFLYDPESRSGTKSTRERCVGWSG